ncbi:uncharacterized protein LOC119601624 [Lucilia sericata]|uniref:uncharacterized protein LOC119601624 n=1 Tax=Lucilia sericata TaxID=13632 RepID=UPI0018A838CB|nr:uncharacterized protein LOC119601624 [Lucilia sericata]
MAFKTFYLALWMFLILFTVVKGSCLEYGHSCWGAHGKRSGNNKIYHTDIKSPTEVDFQDLNGLSEKNTYDSTEEQINASTDSLSANRELAKDIDDLIETSDKPSIKFKKFLYKKLNKTNGKQRNMEPPEHHSAQKSNNMPLISERWRRFPLYNLRRLQITKADNDWLRELERESQTNDDDYI